ncbi:MAG: recombinase family protein [Lawsonibacter sp.]|nr:recombinase family protein [Lawsonibacter sp.]
MSGKIYGYVRVSTKEQKEDRQMDAMREFGVQAKHIVVEKQSGKDFLRPGYLKLVKSMAPGDTLVIKSIDRLGRNYEEILEQWARLTKEKKIAIVVLDMPLLDTREYRDLTGTLIAHIVLQLLSYVAQTEREFIHQRQAEGIASAKALGVQFGRKRLPLPDGFEDMAEDWCFGRISAIQASKELGMSRTTFIRRAEEWGLKEGLLKKSAGR